MFERKDVLNGLTHECSSFAHQPGSHEIGLYIELSYLLHIILFKTIGS